jgi:hypothetical protein
MIVSKTLLFCGLALAAAHFGLWLAGYEGAADAILTWGGPR